MLLEHGMILQVLHILVVLRFIALTEADDAYIMEDDDFGFNELVSEFTDIKKRNPISGNDEAI